MTPAGKDQGTLLFGGSGFLGSHILERYPNVISVGRTPPMTPRRHIAVDSLADLTRLTQVDFDKVIYTVGSSDHHTMRGETIPAGTPTPFEHHVVPLIQVLEQLKGRSLRKFVHFSTILLYDEQQLTLPVSETAPIAPYRDRYVFSKHLAEEVCAYYGNAIPVVNVRLSPTYGPTHLPRFDLINTVIAQLVDAGTATVWSTKPERDFLYVEDAADASVRLLESDFTGTVNLGSGTLAPVSRVVGLLEELSGCTIVNLDIAVKGPMRFQCDTSTLRAVTGWAPRYSLEEGIRRTYRRMKEQRAAQCA